MQKLHIGEFYRKTVPPGTEDCEPDPGFNYDKANTFGENLFKKNVFFRPKLPLPPPPYNVWKITFIFPLS